MSSFGAQPAYPIRSTPIGSGVTVFSSVCAVALDVDHERLPGAERLLLIDLLPGGILHVVNARDAVADLESSFGRRRVL